MDTFTVIQRLHLSTMMMNDARDIERRLAGMSYEGLSKVMGDYETKLLVELLNSKSIRIGDTAASVLTSRKCYREVVESIRSQAIKTKLGKVRALNILKSSGRSFRPALGIYKMLVHDKNPDVVSGALFGIVFMQDGDNFIDELRAAKEKCCQKSKCRDLFVRAIRAICNDNPFIYSPYFRDVNDVWELDKKRFADRIGLAGDGDGNAGG